MGRIRIGNQTACAASQALDPFHFALDNGFDAFEWFSDKKYEYSGLTRGWEESDFDAQERSRIRGIGKDRDMLYSVHAPWQANPLYSDGAGLLMRSLDFARDIGARLVNLHLYMENGANEYVRAMRPVLQYAKQLHVGISIENTPLTSPADFNEVFSQLRSSGELELNTLGMCLDIGHANLCESTRNDFIRYIDGLSPDVPIIHLHVHENYGDRDSHLPLFTGPAGHDDTAIRALLGRMLKRKYDGAMILEQWPHPSYLLTNAARGLKGLLDAAMPLYG